MRIVSRVARRDEVQLAKAFRTVRNLTWRERLDVVGLLYVLQLDPYVRYESVTYLNSKPRVRFTRESAESHHAWLDGSLWKTMLRCGLVTVSNGTAACSQLGRTFTQEWSAQRMKPLEPSFIDRIVGYFTDRKLARALRSLRDLDDEARSLLVRQLVNVELNRSYFYKPLHDNDVCLFLLYDDMIRTTTVSTVIKKAAWNLCVKHKLIDLHRGKISVSGFGSKLLTIMRVTDELS